MQYAAVPLARQDTTARPRAPLSPCEKLLGHLVESGCISTGELRKARQLARTHGVSVQHVLVSEGWLAPDALLTARCICFGATRVHLDHSPPDKTLLLELGIERCLKHTILPWRRLGGRIVWVTDAPELFDEARLELPDDLGPPVLAVAPSVEIQHAISKTCQSELVSLAETSLPDDQSCRRRAILPSASVLPVCALLFLLFLAVPGVLLSALILAATALVAVNVILKAVLSVAALRDRPQQMCPPDTQRLPSISVLVPLLREPEVAATLLSNLLQLKYPRELLEIIFVIEDDDDTTKTTLSHLELPQSFRALQVPRGSIRTKPRALNFALPFCRGDVIGVYDAEDKPDTDQLLKVADAFRHAAPNVACLQGRLDFFNTRTGLLTRCFTAEYAGWFGLQLKGLAALELPVPLGGTTLFLRRDVLERLGRWDAHNVTEDAELGIRLHRAGYRTALLDTVTREEATSTPLAWIRQRSRWIKGYMKTYAVQMRHPKALWKDLGPAGFMSFQVLFLGSVLGTLTMPVLFLMIGAFFGLPVPGVSENLVRDAGRVMLGLEVVNLAVWAAGIRQRHHRHLVWVLPLLHIYFLMASVAALKALTELVTRPYFWDKTRHGVSYEDRAS
ncbi:MAG: glycosyltransferase [Pseudomonadota bacterium]